MVEPSASKKGSSPIWRKSLVWLFVVGILILLGVRAIFHRGNQKTSEAISKNEPANLAALHPVLLTNTAALFASDPRWAGVLGVLNSMKEWSAANPVCHLTIATEGLGGKVYADTEVFRFKSQDGTNLVTRIAVKLRYPNPVNFLVEEEGDQLIAYLPETDQLVKVDARKEISAQYGLDLQNPDTMSFLNLLRIAFVETNATHRALTFAFKPETLNLPAAASADAFTTLRIDEKGALQTVEQTEMNEHRIMRIKYLGFQQDEVERGAPQIPANKPVITGKAFNLALQEEIIKMKEKGTRIKI